MDLDEKNLLILSEYMQHTLNPDVGIRKPAEQFLESVERKKNYPMLLLFLIDKPEVDITLRVAAAVVFKNYIRRNWKVNEEEGDKIHHVDRLTIKTFIVHLMLKSSEAIQKQLSVAVSEIGAHDFPMQWPNLIEEMVQKFESGDFHVINGVLQTAHSLFKKYRVQMKSEVLWREIKFVLDKFAKPLTDLMVNTVELLKTITDPPSLKIIVSSLTMIGKVFYSLNYQDLPEFFEDNMSTWFGNFMVMFKFDCKELHTSDAEESGVIERLRGQICDCIALYAEKYDEEFEPFLSDFVNEVWSLLVSTGSEAKYDHVVGNALGFLRSVAERKRHSAVFKDPSVLDATCNNIVIPNIHFRACDQELFEDNPEEYIRRDIEGSDVDTRRRAACDLVKALSRQFEAEIMAIFGKYLEAMLSKYNENPEQHWTTKDAACYLVTSMVTRGQTEKHGVTQISQLVDLSQFAQIHILPELAKPDLNVLPVLRADAIKYIMVFRSVITPELVISTIPDLVRLLRAPSQVVHTYAAVAIEKILQLRDGNDATLVKPEVLKPLSNDLLSSLFNLLDQPGSEENEYVMKTIFRCFAFLKDAIIPHLNTMLEKLIQKLISVSRNPSKPHFNHYLFETIGLSIKIMCAVSPEAVQNFEQLLFPPFQTIMQQDVQEFIPYVFQLLSMLLEMQPTGSEGTMPPAYLALLPFLLAPALWERQGYVKPLVRLLQTGIARAPLQVIADNRLTGILGVFQKLLASKLNDHEGFYLLQHMIQFLPPEVLEPYLKQIFVLIFTRLQSSKTSKFVLSVIVFFCFFVSRYSGTQLIEMVDSIQSGLFNMVVERLFLEDTQKVSGTVERKIVAIGLTKLLCDTPALQNQYAVYWVPLLQRLVALFELPEDTTRPDFEHYIDVEDVPGYSPAYSQLSSVIKPAFDPVQAVDNPRLFLAQFLIKLSALRPGHYPNLISQMNETEQSYLMAYLRAADGSLS